MDNDTLPQYIQIALSIARRIAGGMFRRERRFPGDPSCPLSTMSHRKRFGKPFGCLETCVSWMCGSKAAYMCFPQTMPSVICMILSQSWMCSISDGISQSYWSSRATSHTNLPICAAVFLTMPCFLFRQTIPCQTIFSAFQRDGMATEGISASCISGRRQVRQS